MGPRVTPDPAGSSGDVRHGVLEEVTPRQLSGSDVTSLRGLASASKLPSTGQQKAAGVSGGWGGGGGGGGVESEEEEEVAATEETEEEEEAEEKDAQLDVITAAGPETPSPTQLQLNRPSNALQFALNYRSINQ